jgi:subtilisin family serine protease
VIGYRYKYNITAVNISEGGDSTFAQKMVGTDYGSLLAQLKSMGVFVAVSSGNDSVASGVEYPAADVSAIAVGSTDVNGSVSSFSDTGADLDLLAPGHNVAVPYIGETGGHVVLLASGTSFSSPIAAGAAVLLKQISPTATVDDILVTLQNSGESTRDPRNGLSFANVNVFSAVSITEAYLRRRRHR